MLVTIKSSHQIDLQLNKSSNANKDDQIQIVDWNINSILRIIFNYLSREDLVEFSTASRKWKSLLTPRTHSKLKMFQSRSIQNEVRSSKLSQNAIVKAEIKRCIRFNKKHSHLVKDFTVEYEPVPKLANQFFSAFTCITDLEFFHLGITESFFISLVDSLKNLKHLNLNRIAINGEFDDSKYNNLQSTTELPSTLEKLSINGIYLAGGPQLFIKVINTHKKLKEFDSKYYTDPVPLNSFLKPYPTLKKFNYDEDSQDNTEKLINAIKFNPQFEVFRIRSKHLNDNFIFTINKYLAKLKELSLIKYGYYELDTINLEVGSNIYTNLTRLEISWNKLRQSSLNSILGKSPNLCYLSITLHSNWKDLTQSIREMCPKLEELRYDTKYANFFSGDSMDEDEFFSTEFGSNAYYACSETLYQLTFINFNFGDGALLNEDHFINFPNLKRIKLTINKNVNKLNTESVDNSLKNWVNFCSLKCFDDDNDDYLEYRLNKINKTL